MSGCQSGFDGGQSGWITPGGGGGGTITSIVSTSGIDVTNPAGPITTLEATFGRAFVASSEVIPVTTTVTPPNSVTFVSLGSALSPIAIDPAKTYLSLVSFFISVSNANTQIWVDLLTNGAPSVVGPSQESLGVAGGRTPRTSISLIPGALLPPTLYFDLVFAKNAGTGSVTMELASLALFEVP